MQVRSLSIKTTEILQLDLAIREEMEAVIDELDALLFAVTFDPMTATQLKAVELRIQTLSQISQLLPEKNLFSKKIAALAETLITLTSAPDELCILEMLDQLNTVRELLKHPPKDDAPPTHRKVPSVAKNHHPSRHHHQFVPFVAKDKTAKDKAARAWVNPEAESLIRARAGLEAEFHLTTEALRDLLRPALSTKEDRVDHLLSHATQVFQDLVQTAKGQAPKPRPTLERIPCLLLSIGGQSFALPQKSVLRVLSPAEYHSQIEAWECPGGRIIRVSGQPAGDICLPKILGLASASPQEHFAYILVKTSRGALLIAAETSGQSTHLVPDLGTPFLSRIGPYLGAAIDPDRRTCTQNQVILILSPEEIAKALNLSQSSASTIAPANTPSLTTSELKESSKSLVAVTLQNKLISIPMDDISHVELVPVSACDSHEGVRSIRIGQSFTMAMDPDEVISSKSSPCRRDIADFQAVIMRRGQHVVAILAREIVGPKQESNLTDFGFDQRPGIRGTALCDDMVVCALDPWAFFEAFSHFSRTTLTRAKIS